MQKSTTKNFKALEIKTKKILSWDFFGNYKTLFKWTWIDFAEIREYVLGDSIKRIDWKTTAKNGKMFVKNYQQERDLKIMFFLDISESMYFWSEEKNKIELLKEIFYLFALSWVKSWNNVWAIIFDWYTEKFIDFEKTEWVIIKILTEINFLNNNKKNNNNFNKKINYINFIKKYNLKDNLIFILSDKTDFDKKNFKALNIYNEINYINIFDFFENNLCDEKINISFKNDKNFMEFNFWNKKKIEEYRKLRKNKIKAFEKNLRKNNINYFNIDTKDDLLRKIMKNY
jgi:uncharacterized protein (DUF58 family)